MNAPIILTATVHRENSKTIAKSGGHIIAHSLSWHEYITSSWIINIHKHEVIKKTETFVLNVSIYIITSSTACPTELVGILVIMSVSTFITNIILYRR